MSTCPVCTFQNSASATACQMCGVPLGDDAPKVCPQCTYSNIIGAVVCSMCNFQLAEVVGAAEVVDDNPMRCKGCTFLNDEGTTECHVCGTSLGVEEGESGDEGGEVSVCVTPALRATTVARLKELHKGASFLEAAFKPIAPFTKDVKMERVTYGAAKALLSANAQV